jgi:hypothetical protein
VKNVMLKAAPAALAMLMLAGCFDDRPGDKVVEPALRKQAETDLFDGLEIVDFKRSNGQVDPDSANRYKVTYTYRLQLTTSYPELVLGLAQDMHKGWLAKGGPREPTSNLDFGALEASLEQVQYAMAAQQWISAQGEGFIPRRDAFLTGCDRCVAFWNSADAPEQADQRRIAWVLAWSHMEGLQFEDSFKAGDGVERYVWHNFEKTEKGWVPST